MNQIENLQQLVQNELTKSRKEILAEILVKVNLILEKQTPVVPAVTPINQQKEKDLQLYKELSDMLLSGKSFREIDADNHKHHGWAASNYYVLCKKYNLTNHNQRHKTIVPFTEAENKEFYDKVNAAIQAGYNSSTVDNYLQYRFGYCMNRYSKICKKYNWENKFKQAKRNLSDETLDKTFYNMVNTYLEQKYKFFEIDKLISKYSGYTSTRYNKVCEKYNLENKNINI